jgi:hypothetical protein
MPRAGTKCQHVNHFGPVLLTVVRRSRMSGAGGAALITSRCADRQRGIQPSPALCRICVVKSGNLDRLPLRDIGNSACKRRKRLIYASAGVC